MSDDQPKDEEQKFAVLEVFGVSLEVSNPRLAELLTMEASDAWTTYVRDMIAADRRAIREALPDVLVATPTPHSEEDNRMRLEFRKRADALGVRLGFEVESNGTWSSAYGIEIVTRTIERPLTVAAASHYVEQVTEVTDKLPETGAVLYIVCGQETADVFKVAIRQRKKYNLMRTVSIDNLEEIASLVESEGLAHRDVLVLLAPIADIDVSEMMSVLHAGLAPMTPPPHED
ncbi:MAG: hypothetical protein JXA36_04715 [Coriobacteriia bacterium]|nr:hypothetical protein [Coriobacteriia bacterium]